MQNKPITGKRGDVAVPQSIVTSVEFSVDKRIEDSKYGYISGYQKPHDVVRQISILKKWFPGLQSADEKLIEQPLPPNAEGWIARPRSEIIASNNVEALKKVFETLSLSRNGRFRNCCEDKINEQYFCSKDKENKHYFRQLDRTKSIFQKICDEQKDHDILLFPVQLGLYYRGNPVYRTLKDTNNSNEFCLDSFTLGIILLTHEKLLNHYEHLWIDCGGDELPSTVKGALPKAPCFRSMGNRVEYAMYTVGAACDIRGSATGFIPQSASSMQMQIAS